MNLRFHRAQALVLLAGVLTLSVSLTPAVAQAGVFHVNRVSRQGRPVTGMISFSASFLGPHVRRVVYMVDGQRRFTAWRRPFLFGRTGRLDTSRLAGGVHVLTIKAVLANGRVTIARAHILVGKAASRVPVRSAPIPVMVPVGARPASAGSASVVNFNRETYSYSSPLALTAEAKQYQVMVLQSTDGGLVRALHAANPALKILVYQHPYFSRASDPAAWSTCTGYASDLADHPDWFLHTADGQFVTTRGGGNFEMDMANPAYQQACLANAVHLAKTYGFDGVFLDDIAASSVWDLPAGVVPAAYPTNAAWQGATTSLLNAAATTLHANGLLVFGNLCGTVISPGLWQQWAAITDGSEEESWTDPGTGTTSDTWAWPRKLADAAWSEAHGKYVILHSYNTTAAGNRFGIASMLLSAAGRTSYSTSNANYTSYEQFYPDYDAAARLGAPLSSYAVLSNGVYERQFRNGIVLVNPTTHTVPAFSLRLGQFAGDGLSTAGALTLPPMSGYILPRTG